MRAAKQRALRDPAAEISPFGHRARQSRSSAHAARRSALLCATPRFVVREKVSFINENTPRAPQRARLVPQARTRQSRAPQHAQPVLQARILRRVGRRARLPARRARQTSTHQQAVLQAPRASATPATRAPQRARLVPQASTRHTWAPQHAQPVLPARILRRQGRRQFAQPVMQASILRRQRSGQKAHLFFSARLYLRS